MVVIENLNNKSHLKMGDLNHREKTRLKLLGKADPKLSQTK
jgi:hypothetical protein